MERAIIEETSTAMSSQSESHKAPHDRSPAYEEVLARRRDA